MVSAFSYVALSFAAKSLSPIPFPRKSRAGKSALRGLDFWLKLATLTCNLNVPS